MFGGVFCDALDRAEFEEFERAKVRGYVACRLLVMRSRTTRSGGFSHGVRKQSPARTLKKSAETLVAELLRLARQHIAILNPALRSTPCSGSIALGPHCSSANDPHAYLAYLVHT